MVIILDAVGLRDFITNHSNNNLFVEAVQSINGYILANHQTINDISNDIQHLRFFKYYNEAVSSIDFSNYRFDNLKVITVADGSLKHIREFVIDGLIGLKTVNIGKMCFRISNRKRDDGIFRIINCPNLCHLEIGTQCFVDFKSFELSNLNSIQSITFGNECFLYVKEFIIKGRIID